MKPGSDIEKDENKSEDYREELLHLHDDTIVFVPAENIRAIERVINNWKEVKQQWDKMTNVDN